ncbi:hypothetical protein C1646_756002 [Rhizophagus diaphanus]|nr:hypothetical protein C1646_756002 [Rhizophagus diaphanus] [Rhizophagus sp. MUCL 43196]
MSVSTEGSEEMFVQVTRETRQASKINQIPLPELDECNVYVQEAIFDKYDAEMIEKDLFIKVHNRIWYVAPGTSCMMMGNKYKPDVGIWFIRPTHAQLHKPFVNACPPPDIYIEVFYNRDPDRGFALEKLAVIQQNNLGIEFIGIALPDGQAPFHQNLNPGVASVPSTPVNPPNVRPPRAPYFVYWNGTNLVYYKID